ARSLASSLACVNMPLILIDVGSVFKVGASILTADYGGSGSVRPLVMTGILRGRRSGHRYPKVSPLPEVSYSTIPFRTTRPRSFVDALVAASTSNSASWDRGLSPPIADPDV